MYDSRDVELVREHQMELWRIAKQSRLAHEAQSHFRSRRRFNMLLDEFRNRFNQVAQHI